MKRYACAYAAIALTLFTSSCSELAPNDEEVIGRDCAKLPPASMQRCHAVRNDCALIAAGQVDEARALVNREYGNRLRLCRQHNSRR